MLGRSLVVKDVCEARTGDLDAAFRSPMCSFCLFGFLALVLLLLLNWSE